MGERGGVWGGTGRYDGTAVRRYDGPSRSCYRPTALPPYRRTAATAVTLAPLAAWGWLRPAPTQPLRRYSLALPPEQALRPVFGGKIALTQDGETLVYRGGPSEERTQLYVRDRSELQARPLPGTEDAIGPMISPDGKRVAFFTGHREGFLGATTIRIADLEGTGAVMTVAENLSMYAVGDWGLDGFIYTNAWWGGLIRIPADGGPVDTLTVLDRSRGEWAHICPQVLPGGRRVLFGIWHGESREAPGEIAVLDLRTRLQKVITSGFAAHYDQRTGQLLVQVDEGGLLAARFDPSRAALVGPPLPLVGRATAEVAIAGGGALVYRVTVGGNQRAKPVRVSRTGRESEIDSSWSPGPYWDVRLSPDGGRLALVGGDSTSGIWIKQLDGGPLSRLTAAENVYSLDWTSDGRDLTGLSTDELLSIRADGSRPAATLLKLVEPVGDAIWSHDGRWLVLRTDAPNFDLRAVRVGNDSASVTISASPRFSEMAATLSPDDRWVAYVSDESGRYEVYVRPFPNAADARWQVSTAGGTEPRWSHGGKEIFYRSAAGEMVAAAVGTTAGFSPGSQRVLFRADAMRANPTHRVYDVTPDDQQFVMLRLEAEASGSQELIVVENWPALLNRKKPR